MKEKQLPVHSVHVYRSKFTVASRGFPATCTDLDDIGWPWPAISSISLGISRAFV